MITNPWFFVPMIIAFLFVVVRVFIAISHFKPKGEYSKDAYSAASPIGMTLSGIGALVTLGVNFEGGKYLSIPENYLAVSAAFGVMAVVAIIFGLFITPGNIGLFLNKDNDTYVFPSYWRPIFLGIYGAMKWAASITVAGIICLMVISLLNQDQVDPVDSGQNAPITAPQTPNSDSNVGDQSPVDK